MAVTGIVAVEALNPETRQADEEEQSCNPGNLAWGHGSATGR